MKKQKWRSLQVSIYPPNHETESMGQYLSTKSRNRKHGSVSIHKIKKQKAWVSIYPTNQENRKHRSVIIQQIKKQKTRVNIYPTNQETETWVRTIPQKMKRKRKNTLKQPYSSNEPKRHALHN